MIHDPTITLTEGSHVQTSVAHLTYTANIACSLSPTVYHIH